MFRCHLLWWLCVISGVLLLITWFALYHFKCLTYAHWDGSLLHQVSHFCLLRWLGMVSGVILSLIGWLCVIWAVTLPFTWMALCGFCYPTAAHWCVFTSFLGSHCCLLKWLSVIPCLFLLLTQVAPYFPRCFSAAPWGRFVLFQIYHCYIIPIVSLSLIE